jgi:hypothetical protein
MRIICILAVAVALAGLAALATRIDAPRASATPAALIDLGAILSGDENEADENEAGDGDSAQQRPAQGRHSRISVVGVLLSAAVGAIVALFVASRLRRLRARIRGWGARWGVTSARRR